MRARSARPRAERRRQQKMFRDPPTPHRRQLLVCGLVALAVGSACSTFGDGVGRKPWGYRPPWLDTLVESTGRVPPEQAPVRARLATPTQWPAGEVPLGRGVPRDLTGAIEWSFAAKISLEQLGFVLRRLGVDQELLGRTLFRLGVTPSDEGVTPAQLGFVLRELGVVSERFENQLRALIATPQKIAVVLGQMGVPPELFDEVLDRLGTSAEEMARAVGDLGRMPSPKPAAPDTRSAQPAEREAERSRGSGASPAPIGAVPWLPVLLGAPWQGAAPPRTAFVDPRLLGLAPDADSGAPSVPWIDPLPGAATADPSAPVDRGGPGGPGAAPGVEVAPRFMTRPFSDAASAAAARSRPDAPTASALESMYSGVLSHVPDRDLEQFGYAYFRERSAVAEDGPVPPDYVVMGGDEIVVTFTGSVRAKHHVQVQQSGEIILPEIGVVEVGGLAFGELEAHISDFVTRVGNRRNFRVDVTMLRLRRFRVHAVGEVERPGIVEVGGRATVLNALAVAGGPKRSGSLRTVEIRRGGERVATVDLYDFLLSGDDAAIVSLRPGDVIFVPPIGPTVGVAGYVQRPGIYEVHREVTIAQAVELAGGWTPFAFRPHAQIESSDRGRSRRPRNVQLDADGLQEVMRDGELLLIGAVEGRRQALVELTGEVVRPGKYEFKDGMRVSDLIELGDGLTVDAFLPQAIVSRVVGAPETVTTVPGREGLGLTRRVIIVDLERAIRNDVAHDLELRPLDQLRVQAIEDATVLPSVSITGAVRRPGTYPLTPGLRVSDLVAIAGNVLPDAHYDEAELIRRSYDAARRQIGIERYRFDLGAALAAGASTDDDPVLANRDELFVRRLRTARVKVRVEGEVRFPGDYVFPQGARISDLIAAAGGVTSMGDIRGAVFSRDSVRQLQQSRFEHLREQTRATYESALERMVQTGNSNEALASRIALRQTADLMTRMQHHQSNGRVVVPFLRDDFPQSPADLPLEDGDALSIPAVQRAVAVVGHVFNPGSFVAEPGMTVRDLVGRSGGIDAQGDLQRLYVIEADGSVRSIEQDHGRLRMDVEVLPGDVVLVPRRPLHRTLGSKLADLLYLARQLGETALLIDALGEDGGIDFTSVYQNQRSGLSVGDGTFFNH